jgi:hypothetical protein
MSEYLASLKQNPVALGSALMLVTLFCVNFVHVDSRNIFALVPVNTLIANSYVWNLVTSSFFETNVVKLAVDLAGLILITQDLDIKSIETFGMYLTFTILACSLGTSTICFLRFFVTADELRLVDPSYGFGGVFFCLATYMRMLKKGAVITSRIPLLTYHNIIFWVFSLQLLLYLCGIHALVKDVSFSFISIIFSWTYLRFVYKSPEGVVGDQSDDFVFVNMFPVVLLPIAVPLTTAFYNLIALTGAFPAIEIEKKASMHHLRQNDSTRSMSESQLLVPRQPDVISERRRAKAQKVFIRFYSFCIEAYWYF